MIILRLMNSEHLQKLRQEADSIFRQIVELEDLGAWDGFAGHPHTIATALNILLLVRVSDLLELCADKGIRVTFTDDVQLSEHVGNVSQLIKWFRNAWTHTDSPRHRFGEGGLRLSTGIQRGRGVVVSFNGQTVGSDYADDVALIAGARHLYLRRHVKRAVGELAEALARVVPDA